MAALIEYLAWRGDLEFCAGPAFRTGGDHRRKCLAFFEPGGPVSAHEQSKDGLVLRFGTFPARKRTERTAADPILSQLESLSSQTGS